VVQKDHCVGITALLIALLGAGTLSAMAAERNHQHANSCTPKDKQVAVFTSPGFSGKCTVLGIGKYPSPVTMGLSGRKIGSIRIRGSVEAVLCHGDFFGAVECAVASIDQRQLLEPATYLEVRRPGDNAGACRPGPSEVTLYGVPNEMGPCIKKGPGSYENPKQLDMITTVGQPDANAPLSFAPDKVRLLQVGKDSQAVVCRNPGLMDCQLFVSGPSHYSITSGVVSLVVQKRGDESCVPGPYEVGLYANANRLGKCTIKGLGKYTDRAAIGLGGNLVRAVRLGEKMEVSVCDADNIGGLCRTIVGEHSGVLFGRSVEVSLLHSRGTDY
jgi:hypothetical protein